MTRAMKTHIRHFDDLSSTELYSLLHLRCRVFVVGQQITEEPEIDGRDPECAHVLARREGELVGTARMFVDEEPIIIGRVAVAPERQGEGIGTAMMEAIQTWLENRPAELHAQAYLEDWYDSLGWQRIGEEFMEADIPHVLMRYNVA